MCMFFKKREEKKSDEIKYFEKHYEERIATYSDVELERLRKEWIKAYDKVDGYVRTQVCGKNVAIRLIHPNKLVDLWKKEKWETRSKYFGIGGNDYVDYSFIRYRIKLRLSVEIYCQLGCRVPLDMKEHYESLSAMDVHDALHYYAKTKV